MSQGKKVKVVVHCQADWTDRIDILRRDLEDQLSAEGALEIRGFFGYLQGLKLEDFLNACEKADVVITDAETGDELDSAVYWTSKQAEESMLEVLQRVRTRNPKAKLFAQLMEGVHKVAAHRIATPHENYSDGNIISALEEAHIWKAKESGDPRPIILVVDDKPVNIKAARNQFCGQLVVTCQSYLDAMSILDGNHPVDVVMTDLMMPCEDENQGNKGQQFVGQEMPMGVFVANKAVEAGVERVFVVSDTNHHDHPAGHVAELLTKSGPISWICGYRCQMIPNEQGVSVKAWSNMLKEDKWYSEVPEIL